MSAIDAVAIVRSYLIRALREVSGMKVLLLDGETIRIVSTALSQSDILDQEVYLVERIDSERRGGELLHLKAVAFLRPTRENVARVRRELREPRFGGYHLYFSNRIDDMRLQDLAEGDSKELVAGVQEAFGDFIPLEAHHVVVPLLRPHLALAPMAWDFGASSDMVTRLTEGVAALALSLRRRFSVRYQRGSEVSQRLAQSLHHLMAVEQRELFDFGSRTRGLETPPLLLILDRRDDPVTPLLSQWTYQAMAHELLTIRDNRVAFVGHPQTDGGARASQSPEREAVLSPSQDPFFAANMYANFGDVGMAVKGLVDAVSRETRQKGMDFQSLEDMSSFVENLPEMSHQQSLTAKHVTLMSELSQEVERRSLMRVSGLEQEIACQATSMASHFEAASSLVRSSLIEPKDKARLTALFALRYERDGKKQISALMAAAAEGGVDHAMLGALRMVLKHCGSERRIVDLFSDRTFTSRFATLAKQHLKGVENVYTQHTPPLVSLLEMAARGKLPEADYLRTDGGGIGPGAGFEDSSSAATAAAKLKLIVVFIVGGTTYEEAKAMAELNASAGRGEGWAAGMRFVLGGTSVQNSTTFLGDLGELEMMERYHSRSGNR